VPLSLLIVATQSAVALLILQPVVRALLFELRGYGSRSTDEEHTVDNGVLTGRRTSSE
jgi:hypothetical protein